MEAVELEKVLQGVEDEDRIEKIVDRDYGTPVLISFLKRFPQLKVYEGVLVVESPEDLQALRSLEWKKLVVYLGSNYPDAQALVEILENKGRTRLVMDSMVVTYQRPQLEITNFHPVHTELVLGLAAMESVRQLKADLPAEVNMKLPVNIKEVETNNTGIRASHGINLRMPEAPEYPVAFDVSVVGLNSPLSLSMVSGLMEVNPQIKNYGILVESLPSERVVSGFFSMDGRGVEGVWIWSRDAEEKEYARSLFYSLNVSVLGY